MADTRNYFPAQRPDLPPLIENARYAVLDCESTGVDRWLDQVIQVAVVQVDFGRPRLRVVCHIQPTRTIHPKALEVHGIGFDILQHALPFHNLAADLLHLMHDRVVLGFGCGTLDVPILRRQFMEHGLSWEPSWLDVMPLQRKCAKLLAAETAAGEQAEHASPPVKLAHNLSASAERWGVTVLPKHDALNDCRMTWNIFLQLASRFPDIGNADLASLVKSAAPAELPAGIEL